MFGTRDPWSVIDRLDISTEFGLLETVGISCR